MSEMKIIVFGASGRTGRQVVPLAVKRGHDVTAFVRDASKQWFPDAVVVHQGNPSDAMSVEAALTGPEHVPVSCHNDLLTANFVRDGARVCIVDWEYAGMNNRYFDLGNLSVNNGFEAEHDRAFLELYFEEPVTERRFAALQLMRLISDFREAMWGVVQHGRSTLDFDYVAYAAEHFERLERAASDPRVEEWLAVAAAA